MRGKCVNGLMREKQRKIELGDWFLSPIYPITISFEYWYYQWGENPIAEFVSPYIINLPTHERIDEDFVNEVYDFLKRSRNAM